jgi:hypothetical protein
MISTTSELVWIKELLEDLDIKIETPMKMHCDNQIGKHIASNLIFHEKTKHIEVDCHFVREKKINQMRSKHHLSRAMIN